MALPSSTLYQDLYVKWLTHLATDRPVKSFFLEGDENIREMRSTFQRLSEVSAFTDWLQLKAQQECAAGGNLNQIGAATFDVMGDGRFY